MNYFERKLNAALTENTTEPKQSKRLKLSNRINPDTIYTRDDNNYTFIYNPDHTLVGGYGDNHPKLMRKMAWYYFPLLGATLAPNDQERSDFFARTSELRARALETKCLAGRSGYVTYKGQKRHFVAFWNKADSQVLQKLLMPCLKELESNGKVDRSTIICIPGLPATILSKFEMSEPEIDDETTEKLRLAQELHTMRGAQKRDAMKKLGVGGGGKPHAMQTAMDKTRTRTPGQKWWAMNSESAE
jgi:hypothetical protein